MATPTLVSIAHGFRNLTLFALDTDGRVWVGEVTVPGVVSVDEAKRGATVTWHVLPSTFEEPR